MLRVLIIGAGYSGATVASLLLKHASPRQIQVFLVNGSGRIARGMAYGTQSPDHTLNVPAGNMSAFDEDPDHFVRYAAQVDSTISGGSFVSRRVYGDYLESLLEQAELETASGNKLERIYENVASVSPHADRILVTLESGKHMNVDKVVLALGHFPSRSPCVSAPTFYSTRRYIADPWNQAQLDSIPANAPVLLLGTGLTSVDVAMTLLRRTPDRPIIAISRRGLLPQYHRLGGGSPLNNGPRAIWGDADDLRTQLKRFRQYVANLALTGRDWREGLALLRPVTANIWHAYSEQDRKRFLRHVQPYWDTHRHRLAPFVAERFDAALKAGVVRPMAGRIFSMDEINDGVEIGLRLRGVGAPCSIHVQYVVNCTGPCTNPNEVTSPLVQQLLRDGVIRTDSLGLGIDVASDCGVMNREGESSNRIFYIGPWLKANYWEATAVPDLRVFARKLVTTLMDGKVPPAI